jgi:tRNA modification GTPase
MRSFLNGKLDLAQAEAVRDLIDSQTGFQARVAREQLEGRLSRRLAPLKDQIVQVICHLETTLEFGEEDVEPESALSLLRSLEKIRIELQELGEGYRVGRIVHEGIQVVVVGRPNTGKSSIFNSLVKSSRAIVTQIPGTTRDALTETINLEGIPARLIDTAGIRSSSDLVESLGVEKSLQYLGQADLVLFVVEACREFGEEDWEVFRLLGSAACILVVNKSDLEACIQVPSEVNAACSEVLRVSALEGWGVPELREAILRAFVPSGGLEKETFFVTNIRHKGCLDSCISHLQKAEEACRRGLSEEFSLYDLRKALDSLAQITGETDVEDILGEIFSTFCVGK